jgi:hypothetical protein
MSMTRCVWDQLRRLSWRQWLLLLAMAAAIAVLIFYAAPALAALGFVPAGAAFLTTLGLPSWAVASLLGLGSTLLFTVLQAVLRCRGR